MLNGMKRYLSEGLWNFSLSRETGRRRFLFKWLRVSYLACKRFYSDRCPLSASSLTYYTLMSLVPMLAMALAVSRGFGYSELMRQQLLERFQEQNEVLNKLFDYADLFLEQAKGGVIAGFGVAILFLTVALFLSNLESILKKKMKIKKKR
jgi:membrane protein